MSDDLYDSLEDECNDKMASSDSLDLLQTKLVGVKRVSNLESINGLRSLCFGNNTNKESEFSKTKEVSVNAGPKNNFLPIINNKNSMPGLQEIFVHSADYETLAKKGLLLNRDGSFTKSAIDFEELPFIAREYKNLVFQKRKIYNSKKQSSSVKIQKTKSCNEKEALKYDQGKLIGNKQCVESINKKSSFEETDTNFDKNLVTNLTDSMKQELLQNISQKSKHQSLEKTNGKQNAKLCISETRTSKNGSLGKTESKVKDLNILNRRLTQYAKNTEKQRLTYLEQQQLRNGYNPLSLRHGIKKITSDTTRSNFGDLMTGKLSDVSSRVLSVEDVTDLEAEEKFYKEIIAKEKNGAVKTGKSSIVAGLSSKDTKHGSVIGSHSLKDLEKLRGSERSSTKQILKPLSIDIKHDGGLTTKKCSHYCSKDSSPKMSKIELALKGKTYGYMANARNIFKFNSRADEKLSAKEDLSPKFNELRFGHKQNSEMTLNTNGCIKKTLPTLNLAKKVKSGLERSSGRPLKVTGLRNAEDSKENEKSVCLPHVSSSETRNCQINSKNVLKINSCLYCPGYQNEDQITVH